MIKKTDIGDIRVELEIDDEVLPHTVRVYHVKTFSVGERLGRYDEEGTLLLEEWEYPYDRLRAMVEYDKLRLLLGKIAGIHTFNSK